MGTTTNSGSNANNSKANSSNASGKPKSSADDFDLSSLFVGPANVLTGVLGVADNARKTMGGIMETIASLQRAAKTLEQLTSRLDAVVGELETPIRLLAPELEKATARLIRVSEAFEAPVDRLIPGLESAIASLDRLSVSSLPDTLDLAQRQISAVLDVLREFPKGLGGIGELMTAGLEAGLGLGRKAMNAPKTVANATSGKASASSRSRPAPTTRVPAKKQTTSRGPTKRTPGSRS